MAAEGRQWSLEFGSSDDTPDTPFPLFNELQLEELAFFDLLLGRSKMSFTLKPKVLPSLTAPELLEALLNIFIIDNTFIA